MIMTRNEMIAEPLYEAPAIDVLNMQNEGILCASTQEFDDETDATNLFGW